MRLEKHVACLAEIKNGKIQVRKPERKSLKPSQRWKNNTKTDFKEINVWT
jgi:hypothetical protein